MYFQILIPVTSVKRLNVFLRNFCAGSEKNFFFKEIIFRSARYIAFINSVGPTSHFLSNVNATFVALIDLFCDILFLWKERQEKRCLTLVFVYKALMSVEIWQGLVTS